MAGIFLDGVADSVPETGAANAAFYEALAAYIHTKHSNRGEDQRPGDAGAGYFAPSTLRRNALRLCVCIVPNPARKPSRISASGSGFTE